MGARRESRAFRKGFMLGALTAAGAVVWTAPQPGWRTREQIMETVEGVLFRVLDFPETMSGLRASEPSSTVDALAAEPPVNAIPPAAPSFAGTGTANAGGIGAAGDASAATIERDIVIDGPRPSELAR
jgi:hypothetical protein